MVDRVFCAVREHANDYLNDLKTAYTDFQNAYGKLSKSTDITEEQQEQFATERQATRGQLTQTNEALVQLKSSCDEALKPPPPPAPAAVAGAAQAQNERGPKAVPTLKPDPLSRDHNPVEFENWKKAFIAYYTASNLDKAKPIEQQAYIRSCTDAYLMSRIQSDLNEATLAYSTDRTTKTCLTLLTAEFEKIYPIFSRRYEYYESRQADGQQFSDWAHELRLLGDEAKLEEMTVEDIKAMRYLTGCRDPQLRERFLKLEEPNVKNFDKVVDIYEAGNKKLSSMSNSKNSTSTAFVQNQRNNGKYNSPHSNRTAQNTRSTKLKSICHACGYDARHYGRECPAKNHKCNNCQKTGHFEQRCHIKPNTAAHSNSRQRDDEVQTSYVYALNPKHLSQPKVDVHLQGKGQDGQIITHKCLLIADSGTRMPILNSKLLKKARISYTKLTASAKTANNTKLNYCGKILIKFKLGNITSPPTLCYVSHELATDGLLSTGLLKALHILPPNFPKQIPAEKPTLTDPKQEYFAPTAPMDTISLSLLKIQNEHFLCAIDMYSDYPLVAQLANTDISEITQVFETWFNTNGYPTAIITANESHFQSTKFQDYCEYHEIKRLYETNTHPMVERILNVLLNTPSQTGRKTAITKLRNTPPVTVDGKTPSELFLGRKIRTSMNTTACDNEEDYTMTRSNLTPPSIRDLTRPRQQRRQ